MKKFLLIAGLFLLSFNTFAQSKVFIAVKNDRKVFHKISDDIKEYLEDNYKVKVLIGKYNLLPKIKPGQFAAIIIINADLTSGYTRDIQSFTKNFKGDKKSILVTSFYKNMKKQIKEENLNGVDVLTAASSMEDEKRSIFSKISKMIGSRLK